MQVSNFPLAFLPLNQQLTTDPGACLLLYLDLFLAVATSAAEVGAIRPNEVAMRISTVSFYSINKSTWDDTLVSDRIDSSAEVDAETQASQASIYEHPCSGLKKYMANGTFYFAKQSSFDLSTRLDQRLTGARKGKQEVESDISEYDDRFVWNSYMLEPLLEYRSRLIEEERANFDGGGFVLLAIQGYCGVQVLSSSWSSQNQKQSSVALVSRLGWKRAGTRFNARGIDDDGNVANFVESELLFFHDSITYSHVQLRGSVPLFWEQAGMQALGTKIQITRPLVASQPAFDRHFADLCERYERVHALNLLGTRDVETVLTTAYSDHMKATIAEDVALSNFDFHSVSRTVGGIDGVRRELQHVAAVQTQTPEFGFTVVDREGNVRIRQEGVFRTNCLDCLDRTNVVQDFLSQFALDAFLTRASTSNDAFRDFTNSNNSIWMALRSLWGQNGDSLSRIYAGTGALNTSFTKSGKKTLGGLLSNAVKSAARTYINNFQDKDKQNVIDLLLGMMANQSPVKIVDVIHDAIEEELIERLDEFSSMEEVTLFVGTWNLNAKAPGEPLDAWLFPDGKADADIYALGFQEIVELTPQQMLMTDPAKKKVWEAALLDAFARKQQGSEKGSGYFVLRSEQLVGTALIIIVKESLLPHIRGVEAASKKTGLKGMSGNKGGVGVRMTCFDSNLCFVTAHMAAGHSNIEERNADYWTISNGLVFRRGKTISSHDVVIWLGDFNYRIGLTNELARDYASHDDYDALQEQDQLLICRGAGTAFPGYDEGPLVFRPTYKYDNGRDTYDSSEKQRVPAWTDRILYRPDNLKQRTYYRAELKTSDHRPVYGVFSAELRSIDHAKRRTLYDELLQGMAPGRMVTRALAPPMEPSNEWWEEDDGDKETDVVANGVNQDSSSAIRRAPPPRPDVQQ